MKVTLLIGLLLSPLIAANASVSESIACGNSSTSFPEGFYHPNYSSNNAGPLLVCLNGEDVTGYISDGGYITSLWNVGAGGLDMLYTVHSQDNPSTGYVSHVFIDKENKPIRDVILKEFESTDPKKNLINLKLSWISESGTVYLMSDAWETSPAIHSFKIPDNSARLSWMPESLKYVTHGWFNSPGSWSAAKENQDRFVAEQNVMSENGRDTRMNLIASDGEMICEIDTGIDSWALELGCKK